MRVKVTTADGKTELGELNMEARADVIVWGSRYFILHHQGPPMAAGFAWYREAVVAFVKDDKKIGGEDPK